MIIEHFLQFCGEKEQISPALVSRTVTQLMYKESLPMAPGRSSRCLLTISRWGRARDTAVSAALNGRRVCS